MAYYRKNKMTAGDNPPIGILLCTAAGKELDGVGNCVVNDVGDGVYAGYHTLIARAKDPRNSKYLSYLFQTDCWCEQLRKRACGIKVFSLTQRLHSCGLQRGAFRPPEDFNAVRTVIREMENIRQMRTQSILAIQKSMDQMNIRLHHAVSDIDGVTGMRMLSAIVGGERDPHALAALRDRRCRKSEAEIAEELTGNWREEHLFNLKQAFETLVFLDGRIADYDIQVRAMFAKLAGKFPPVDPPPEGGDGPGRAKDKEDAKAKADLARICGGFDMTRLDGIGHQSAGKNASSRKKHRNTSHVGLTLKMCASTLFRSESSLGARFRSTRSRTCSRTAIKDVAREMARRIYRGIKYGQAYVDEGELAYLARTRERTIKAMKKKISKLSISA